MVILFVHQIAKDVSFFYPNYLANDQVFKECLDMAVVHFQKFYSLSKSISDEPFNTKFGFSSISSLKLNSKVSN
jgi:hypothetical protein